MDGKTQDILVVYYSRTGHSQELADALANALGANTYEIEPRRYFLPGLGYLRAGYDSLRGNLPRLAKPVPNFRDYACIVLCGPVWTSYPAVPLRAFLAQYKATLPDEVALFLTSGDHSPAQKAFAMASDLLGHPFKVAMNISNDDQDKFGVDDKVAAFCAALEAPESNQATA